MRRGFTGVPEGGSGTLLQSLYTRLAADLTNTDTTFPGLTLLTQAITTQAGSLLLIHFDASASMAAATNYNAFRLLLDGVAQMGCACHSAGTGQFATAAATLQLSGVAAGAHTITVDWAVQASTGRIRPVTVPDTEHAALLVQELLLA